MVRLQWRPDVFWSSTMTEFMSAMDFWAVVNGLKKTGSAPTRERLEELKRLYG